MILEGSILPVTTPGHAERDNSPPPGLLVDQIDFLTVAHTTTRSDKNLNAFLEFTERRILHSIEKHGHYIEEEN